MSTTGELLSAARDLVVGNRSDGPDAQMEDGTPCDPIHPDAAKYSIWGALRRASYDRGDSTGMDAALMLLGANNLQDRKMAGHSRSLSDEDLGKRFDDAIERANGGPVKETSWESKESAWNAERRMGDTTGNIQRRIDEEQSLLQQKQEKAEQEEQEDKV